MRQTGCYLDKVLLAALFFCALQPTAAAQPIVTARAGIQILTGDAMRRARATDRLHKKDRLRIIIEPKFDAYVYAIYAGDSGIRLLRNGQVKTPARTRLFLPSNHEDYEVDGESRTERITIISSAGPLPALAKLAQSGAFTPAQWVALETELIEKCELALRENPAKPFAIAGNVREVYRTDEEFINDLPWCSGKSMVIQRFDFRVQK